MVTLRKLLGSRSEVVYECMYTKNKTQKRKVWHDGFVSLSASRKLVLFEDMPPAGKVLDEAKMTPYDWDRRDEEFINVPKFLVEVINETPIAIPGSSGGEGSSASYAAFEQSANAAPLDSDLPPPRSMHSRFRVPVSTGNAPPPRLVTQPGGGARQPLGRAANPARQPLHSAAASSNSRSDLFDFERNPTSEWSYEPNAINRSAAEVAALFNSHS